MPQEIIWKAKPSQIENLWIYILCGLTAWLIIPIFIGIWHYLVIRNEEYVLSKSTLTLHEGVLNKTVNDVELYRVKDIQLKRSLFLRLFGLGDIHLMTSDHTNPYVKIKAIPNSVELRTQLRNLVENSRRERGVREFDMN